ncbi:MAG: hypothetical protein RIF41_10990 [Polyangiaceae bacterium]
MTLLFEIGVWVGSGLLAAVLLSRRGLLLGVLAATSGAVTFAAFARIATETPWPSDHVHVVGLVAAGIGGVLGALAVRGLNDALGGRRGPSSAGYWSGPRSAP